MISWLLRALMLAVELGATALAILLVLNQMDTNSWFFDFTRGGDYLAWMLFIDVLLAFLLALRVEQKRAIRYFSVTFHLGLVLLAAYATVGWYFGD
jgi:hypothetical protein